jgi:hypothetical protein
MGWEEIERMPPKVREKYREAARRLSPEQRLRRSFELTSFATEMMAAGLRKRHPEMTEDEIRWEIIARRLPADLRKKAYGR